RRALRLRTLLLDGVRHGSVEYVPHPLGIGRLPSVDPATTSSISLAPAPGTPSFLPVSPPAGRRVRLRGAVAAPRGVSGGRWCRRCTRRTHLVAVAPSARGSPGCGRWSSSAGRG